MNLIHNIDAAYINWYQRFIADALQERGVSLLTQYSVMARRIGNRFDSRYFSSYGAYPELAVGLLGCRYSNDPSCGSSLAESGQSKEADAFGGADGKSCAHVR